MASPFVVHDPEFLRVLGDLYVTDSGANQEAGSFYPHLPHHVIAYDVDHGRRSGPGAVELHDHETDIMHVVHGSATVVTGEDEHTLGVGDVLVIPNGVPHQFVDVTAPFFYFVTKVQS